jgi:hypothetical protein
VHQSPKFSPCKKIDKYEIEGSIVLRGMVSVDERLYGINVGLFVYNICGSS